MRPWIVAVAIVVMNLSPVLVVAGAGWMILIEDWVRQ